MCSKKNQKQRSRSAAAREPPQTDRSQEDEESRTAECRTARLQKFRENVQSRLSRDEIDVAWSNARREGKEAEAESTRRWSRQLEEEHEGDSADSWKKRIFETMPQIDRDDAESSNVDLQIVCERGRAHLEGAQHRAAESDAQVRSLASSFEVPLACSHDRADQLAEEVLSVRDTPSTPTWAQGYGERSHLKSLHKSLFNRSWKVDELLE